MYMYMYMHVYLHCMCAEVRLSCAVYMCVCAYHVQSVHVCAYHVQCTCVCVPIMCRAYHGHTKPLVGLSSYKMKQEKEGQARISPNPHAWIVSPLHTQRKCCDVESVDVCTEFKQYTLSCMFMCMYTIYVHNIYRY